MEQSHLNCLCDHTNNQILQLWKIGSTKIQIKPATKGLSQASARMKLYADKKRSEMSFDEGNWIFLKLHPYKEQSVEHKQNYKLRARYFGPYQIIKKIGHF